MMKTDIIPITDSDLVDIKEIYDHYILNTTVTLRKHPPDLTEIATIYPVHNTRHQTFLIRQEVDVIGYCSYGPYKNEEAYARTAQIALYLKPGNIRQGVGKLMLSHLEKTAFERGIRVLLAFVTAENEGSIRFLTKFDFKSCAHFKNIGEKFNRILDVLVFQKEL
jgi:L-amino acid N-acyltransferase YncA